MVRKSLTVCLTSAFVSIVVQSANAQTSSAREEQLVFGGKADVAYAVRLWEALREIRLVGRDAISSRPYEGAEPHGAILTVMEIELTIDGHEGPVIVKNNYGGENVSIQSVSDNPRLNLAAITVMFRREAGYDPEARNWFWVKYNPDGTLSKNPHGLQLAGRISRNPEDACIGCHQFAPGNDYVFLNDRFAVPEAFATAEEDLTAKRIAGLLPLEQQPDASQLQPGLAVTYYYNIFNIVGEIREFAGLASGERGEALLTLDYNVGSGAVLTSTNRDGVGAVIEGLIRFPEAGTYTMAMQSNDGVELTIGGLVIVSDPTVHADLFSGLISLEIEEPGWYPLRLLYFEKRNTATLELYWLRPGEEGGLNFVPAEVLAHLSG